MYGGVAPGKGRQAWQAAARPPAWSAQKLAPQVAKPVVKKEAVAPDVQPALVVYSTKERDDIGIRTLVGDYVEEGTNHGRKTYRKTDKITGHEDIDVHLYFWDERDGTEFSGWWFGSKVGGAQVWSRSVSKSLTPPRGGWTIPWDGEINKDLVVMLAQEKVAQEKMQAKQAQMARLQEEEESVTVDWEKRVQEASERVAGNVIDASEAMEAAASALEGDDIDEAAIKAAADELTTCQTALAETQRFLANEGIAAQKAPPQLKADMAAFVQRVRKLQQSVKDDLQKCRNYKLIKKKAAEEAAKKAEEEARNQELEIQHTKQLEEMMPAVIEKVDTAEDEVEKVAIAAAPLQVDTAEDLRPVMLQAIKETEQRVRAAQAAIGEAKRFITGKLTQANRFVGNTKKTAIEDFNGLQEKLNEAQEKINPYKTIRQDYEQRIQGKKILDELNSKIAGAEIEVEKAAMMTAPLGGESLEGIKETEAALGAAQSALSQSSRLVDSKLKTLEKQKGPVYDDVKQLQDRAKAAQEKLDDIRKTVKETQVRVAADTLLKDASEKVSTAEDELQKMAEAELPFLKGTPKGPELDELIEQGEKMATQVHNALGEAQTFVAKKLVEVARFSEGHARAVREDLDALQKRLAEGRSRLQQFRASTNDRKRSHMLQEVETKISSAEDEVRQMTEATAALGAVGLAGDVVSDSLKDTLEKANAAERTAQESIVVARKSLLQKTAELKNLGIAGMGSGSELGKFQTRVNNMQQEIAKLRNATKDAEERVRVKQTLAEVSLRLQAAEAEVDKVAAMSAPTDDELPSLESVERLDKQSTSAQTKLGATLKLVEIKLKSAQGVLKDELQGMKTRLTSAEKKLNAVLSATREQKERVRTQEIVSEAVSKVEKAESDLMKSSEAELPFLKGIEVGGKEAENAVSLCEATAAETQQSITAARSYVVEKLAEAKKLSEKPAQTCIADLTSLQKKLDAAASRLAELKKDTVERKRKIQMQASADKIAGVEKAVQGLATTMAKFGDDKLSELSAEEARSLTEEIAAAEQAAKKSVSAARKFLAERLQEIKGYSEAQRAPMMADITKLQSRLTQCQVELAKLSNQCTEREQRFVAQKLVEDANQSLEKLRADIEGASKVAAPVLSGDSAVMLKAVYAQAVVGAIQTHMKKTDTTLETVFGNVTTKKEASAEEFAAFLDKLSESSGKDDIALTQGQVADVFTTLGAKKDAITAAQLKAACKECSLCTIAVALKENVEEGAKELAVVEVGEAIVIDEKKEDSKGNTLGQCTLARDGTKGWALLKTTDGTVCFKPSPSGAPLLESVVAYISEINSRCAEELESMGQKALEVSSVKQGPLAEVKEKLLQLKMKLSQEQTKIEQLKGKVVGAKAEVTKLRREEQSALQEVKCKEFAAKTKKEATAAVEAAEAKANAVIESAKNGDGERTIQQLEKLKGTADEALKSLDDAKAVIARIQAAYEGFKATSKQSLLEARVEIAKMKSRVETTHRKCVTATESVRTACAKLVKAAIDGARSALRTSARSKGNKGYDELFSELAGGKDEMSEAQFTKFVNGLPNHGLSKEQVKMMYTEFGPNGLKKVGFAKLVQEYMSCSKSIMITDGYDIESSNATRKLEPGELFEVLEGPREDPETKVSRVRGRAIRDGTVGWVSVKGNEGTAYLKSTEKPYMSSLGTAPIYESFSTTASTVRNLAPGEVLELLEGPRDDAPVAEVRLKCKVAKDDAEGWITVKGAAGVNATECQNFYVCKSTIAMTDVVDLKNCKVLKKVVVGEVLQAVEPEKEADGTIGRLKFRSLKDGKEGWVTVKGNQGTVYLEISKSHYLIDKAVTLSSSVATDSEKVRELAVGEAVEGLEAPSEQRPESKLGFRARSHADGKIGWVIFSTSAGPPPVKPCSPKL